MRAEEPAVLGANPAVLLVVHRPHILPEMAFDGEHSVISYPLFALRFTCFLFFLLLVYKLLAMFQLKFAAALTLG